MGKDGQGVPHWYLREVRKGAMKIMWEQYLGSGGKLADKMGAVRKF